MAAEPKPRLNPAACPVRCPLQQAPADRGQHLLRHHQQRRLRHLQQRERFHHSPGLSGHHQQLHHRWRDPVDRQDTTPGSEFFCWALKTSGGNEDLHRDGCHAVYKSPGTTGWHSIAIFPKTAKQFYGQTVLVGYAGEQFTSFSSPFTNGVPAGTQQLRSRLTLGFFEGTLEAQGLLNTPPPLVQLPPQLFIDSTRLLGPTTHFGKVTFPDGVMLQLARSPPIGMCGCGCRLAPATATAVPGPQSWG